MSEPGDAAWRDKVGTFPRPCGVHSSGFYARGMCHALGADEQGAFAVVEYESGRVDAVRLNGPYSVKFEDVRE
jgi:hypothetical protein